MREKQDVPVHPDHTGADMFAGIPFGALSADLCCYLPWAKGEAGRVSDVIQSALHEQKEQNRSTPGEVKANKRWCYGRRF